MTVRRLFLLLACLGAASCANPGQTYAGRHPELSQAHRQILATGKIPSGDAVAGLTHEEVRLAMGGPPAVFDKVNGQETWSYLKKSSAPITSTASEPDPAGHGRPTDLRNEVGDVEFNVVVRTTIFFAGDRATRAEVTQEKP